MATLNLKGAASGQIALTVPSVAGDNVVTIQALTGDVLVSTVTMILPTSLGTNGYVLKTDGAGNLSWGAAGGGGSVTDVSTTLSGITVDTPTTTPVIKGTLGVSSGGTGLTSVGTAGQVLTTNGAENAIVWSTPVPPFTVSTVTSNYLLALSDASSMVQYNSVSAGTITVPTNAVAAFTIGTEIEVSQINSGALTIAASGGVTINAPNGLYFNRQNQAARLRKVATNTWNLAYYGYPSRADLPVYPSTNITGAVSLNRNNGEVQRLVLTGNVTSMTISNFGTAGVLCKLVFEIWNSGAFTLTWPVGTIWPSGITPQVTSGDGSKDVYILMTMDGGTTIYGTIVGQAYA